DAPSLLSEIYRFDWSAAAVRLFVFPVSFNVSASSAICDWLLRPPRAPELAMKLPLPAVSSAVASKPEPLPSRHSLIWSERPEICSLIWLRRDHRKTPAATAPPTAAAAAKGRSRAVSIQPLLYWL